jgi:hypothetical protein
MSRYAASQALRAFVLTFAGAAKGVRLLVDMVEDSISAAAGPE